MLILITASHSFYVETLSHLHKMVNKNDEDKKKSKGKELQRDHDFKGKGIQEQEHEKWLQRLPIVLNPLFPTQ